MTVPPLAGTPQGPLPSDDLRRNRAGQSAQDMAADLTAKGTKANQVRSWELGAVGERLAGEVLTRLPRGWTVLHDVPVGVKGANIDHVVFGPAGVFTVNTKHHKDRNVLVSGTDTWVDGNNYPHVAKALAEADRASALLTQAMGAPVYVRPVLLFVGAKSLTIDGDLLPNLTVGTDVDVCSFLTNTPDTINPTALAQLVTAAARPEVWAQASTPVSPQALRDYTTHPTSRPLGARVRSRPVSSHQPTPRTPATLHQPEPTPTDKRNMSASPKKSLLRFVVVLILGLLFIAAIKGGLLTVVSDMVGKKMVEDITDTSGPEIEKAAADVFVPKAKKQFPKLVKGTNNHDLTSIAVNACETLTAYTTKADFNTKVVAFTSNHLNNPTRTQTIRVLHLATDTACPTRSSIITKFAR